MVTTVDPCIWSAEVLRGKGDCVVLAGCFTDSLTARRGKGKRAMNACLVQTCFSLTGKQPVTNGFMVERQEHALLLTVGALEGQEL